ESGQNQTGHAIQPSCTRDKHFEEGKAGMGDQLVRMKTLLLLHHSTSHEIGVPIHFLQVMIQVPEWILQDMLLEISGDAVQFEPFVDQVIPIPHSVLSEQLGLPVIGIPAPMS